ncbi:hypothetical protein, partial [Raoultella ornithinolytica]|uniref:hypothetical protein n=1 Tax=Raoultella ornithinolytica TaxID=54291 RepID=UPI003850C8E3
GSINAKDKSIFLKESSSTLFQPIRPESSRLPESLLLGNNQDPPRLMWVKAGTQHESAFHLPSVVGTGLLLKECASSCDVYKRTGAPVDAIFNPPDNGFLRVNTCLHAWR